MKLTKFEVTGCPTGINDSWNGFPWESYPGGVEVTFAIVKGSCLMLTRPNRWSVTMPALHLNRGQVLADVVAQFLQQLDTMGATISLVEGDLEVCACHGDGRTFQVLVLMPVLRAGPMGVFERVEDDPLMLKGYASENVMAAYLARLLGWSSMETGKYLPLPTSVALAQAA